MIRVGICDDEKIILEMLRKIISTCLEALGVEAELALFHKGRELLEAGENLDILFLDIEMPQMDGIETGKKLRQQGADCKIIVATSQIERFKEAFHIEAFRFVTKPFETEEIREVLKETVAALETTGKIEAYKDRAKCEILQRDILYIEAVDSSVEIVLQEERYRKESSLTELEKKLDDKAFFRINRQCIVNMAQIEKYEKGIVFIDNKKKKVSQRRKKEFMTAYREYMAWR